MFDIVIDKNTSELEVCVSVWWERKDGTECCGNLYVDTRITMIL